MVQVFPTLELRKGDAMDGELLWKEVYRFVRKAAGRFRGEQSRRGRPDTYAIDDVALCWLWAAFRNRSLSAVMSQLKSPRERRLWTLMGFPGRRMFLTRRLF